MLSRLTLANGEGTDVVIHEDAATSKRSLIDVKGLVGVGPLRSSKRVRPQAHGSINETQFEEGRTIQMTGEVMSQVSIEKALEEFRKISQVLLESLDNGGALMKWTEDTTGNKLQQMVQLDSEVEPTLQEAAAFLTYPVSLFAEDPRAYSQTLTEATGATITGSGGEPTFITSVATLSGIAVDSTHIYWANRTTNAIGRAAIGGGTIEPEWIKVTGGNPQDVTVDAAHVYWTVVNGGTGSGGCLGRATIAGGTIEQTWVDLAQKPGPIAVDANFVYWCNNQTEEGLRGISRVKLAGTGKELNWISGLRGGGFNGGLAVDASFIYWGEPFNIGRATITGGSINKTFIAQDGEGIAVDASFIYWSNGTTIGRAAIGGTGVTPAWLTGLPHTAMRLAKDATHVYWINQAAQSIGRVGVAGGPQGGALTIAQAGNRPTPLTIKIHGPITNPCVVRESDGSRITLVGTISSGNFVELNVANRTVTLNGLGVLSMLDPENTNWSAFSPLASAKYLLAGASATAAFMEIAYRAAFA